MSDIYDRLSRNETGLASVVTALESMKNHIDANFKRVEEWMASNRPNVLGYSVAAVATITLLVTMANLALTPQKDRLTSSPE